MSDVPKTSKSFAMPPGGRVFDSRRRTLLVLNGLRSFSQDGTSSEIYHSTRSPTQNKERELAALHSKHSNPDMHILAAEARRH